MKKTILFLTIIFFSFLAGKCVFAYTGDLSIYHFDDKAQIGKDSLSVNDFTCGYAGINENAPYPKFGDSALWQNTGDHLYCYNMNGGTNYSMSTAGASIGGWLKTDHQAGVASTLLMLNTATSNEVLSMQIRNYPNAFSCFTSLGGGVRAQYNFNYTDNVYHLWGCTISDGQISINVDGDEKETKNIYDNLYDETLIKHTINLIQTGFNWGQNTFIDDLFVNTVGITKADFAEIYSAKTNYPPQPPKLITAISPLSSQQFVSASTSVDFTFQYNRTDTPDALAFLGIEDMNNGTLYTLWPELTELTGEKTSHVNLPNGTYGWSVVLFDRTNLPYVQLASTTPEYFAVLAQKQTENICAGIQTTTGITDFHLWGDLVCGTKTFSLWAFTPTQTSLDNFSDRFDDFKDSFPFNAFFDLTDTVSGAIATSSTESMAGTVKVPFITATGTFIMLPVLASSSLPNLIGSTNAKLIRDSITWFLWLGAGVLVFLTFKKI